jgi:hypothetical protein
VTAEELVRMCERKILDLGSEVAGGREGTAADDLANQDRKPDLDLIEPRGMFGRDGAV